MSVHTFNTAVKQQASTKTGHQEAQACDLDAHQAQPANVVNIRSARKAQETAQKELMDYLMWTMKHDMDPHRLYDDPIEVFRAELKIVVGMA